MSSIRLQTNRDKEPRFAIRLSSIPLMRLVRFVVCCAIAFVSPIASADWKIDRTINAAEAHQAAAADERFVYAITNKVVAKYDRTSGERIAVSTGEASHLNSGFFHDGHLLCAHSNYPSVPEISQIKSLDTKSMKLTTFRDFGDFGGSLTWVVRHDEHWWCNFAKYGAENTKSFLVRFDKDWQESGRWTYPPEVIKQLGQYSLSGGVWRTNQFLATDHDNGVLYQLEIPETGSVLKFTGKQSVPFTGQGIAIDPATNGLVGINRAKKQIVFATRSDEKDPGDNSMQLRILSYNIHHAEGIDRKLDLERIARVILAEKPDLVALQEVEQKTGRTNRIDQPAELGRLTKMRSAFGQNIDFQGGGYGNAILSRWPITKHENVKLPNFENGEQRGILIATVDLPTATFKPNSDASPTAIRFLATHFDHRPKDQERVASAKQLNTWATAAENSDQLAILAGDMNDVIGSESLKLLAQQWTQTSDKEHATIPVTEPKRQIDFVLVRPAKRWKLKEVRVLEEAIASDHRAILAVIELVP